MLCYDKVVKTAYLAPQLTEMHGGKTILDAYDSRWKRWGEQYGLDIQYLSRHAEPIIAKNSLLILPGGGDVFELSKQKIDKIRDNMNQQLLERHVERGGKVLAICRSAQKLNLTHGGKISLLRSHVGCVHKVKHLPTATSFSVNSFHRYGIRSHELAESFDPILIDSKRNIEGYYAFNRQVLGLLWHPERSGNSSRTRFFLKRFFDEKKI